MYQNLRRNFDISCYKMFHFASNHDYFEFNVMLWWNFNCSFHLHPSRKPIKVHGNNKICIYDNFFFAISGQEAVLLTIRISLLTKYFAVRSYMECASIAIKLCVLLILVCGVWSNRSSQNVRVIKSKFRARAMLRKFAYWILLSNLSRFRVSKTLPIPVSTLFFK